MSDSIPDTATNNVSAFVYKTINEQRDICISLTDPDLINAALELSFYTAMLDAARDDPMDNAAEQEELIEFFADQIQVLTGKYQELVNNLI